MHEGSHPEPKLRSIFTLATYLYLVLPVTFFAFLSTYFSGVTFSGKPVNFFVHAHSFLAVLWIVMLATQATLVQQRKIKLHRLIGKSSYVIAPLVLMSLILFSHYSLNRTTEPLSVFDARVFIFNFGQFTGFALAWALAIYFRKRTPLHMRFMISTVLAFGSAIVFRLLLNYFGWLPGLGTFDGVVWANGIVLTAGVGALTWRDWRLNIRPSPYLMVLSVNLIMSIGFLTFTKFAWWYAFVVWFMRL